MDKNTLSNYGWIAIAVLVLSVMIALATPFGSYIEQGVRSTTASLFDTSEKALNVVGMSAGSGNFEDGYTGIDDSNKTDDTEQIELPTSCVTRREFVYDETLGTYVEIEKYYTWDEVVALYGITGDTLGRRAFDDPNVLEIILPETIRILETGAFRDCNNMQNITLTYNIITIQQSAFEDTDNLTHINFVGTVEQWNNITIENNWINKNIQVICIDGVVDVIIS